MYRQRVCPARTNVGIGNHRATLSHQADRTDATRGAGARAHAATPRWCAGDAFSTVAWARSHLWHQPPRREEQLPAGQALRRSHAASGGQPSDTSAASRSIRFWEDRHGSHFRWIMLTITCHVVASAKAAVPLPKSPRQIEFPFDCACASEPPFHATRSLAP